MERLFFKVLKDDLDKHHISLVIGARQVGKTTLIKQLRNELENNKQRTAFINLENKKFRALLNETPENVFQLIPPLEKQSKLFLFIDEVQYLEDPSNFLKYLHDEYRQQIKFIVTGSSSFYIDRKFKDSLAGRKRILEITPLSFKEMLQFKEHQDMAGVLNRGNIPLIQQEEILRLFFEYLTYGGYPEVVLSDNFEEKILILKELADSYAKKDVVEAEIKKPDAYFKLFRILAERTGSLVNIRSLSADLGLDSKTVEGYLWVLRKSFHIHYVTPFYKNISSELRKMPKLYFNDLGLRNYLVGSFEPIGLRPDRGLVLENYVYMLFKEYYAADNIKFWRTQKNQEVDFVVSDFFGKTKAIEIKYDQKNIRHKQYKYFAGNYPDIPLSFLDLKSVLQFEVKIQ
ncbi:MAG: ATP-binding protein [Proteobacteria bacterium]|nr:ATP-binding protein [Pseudomonadota bacterium]